ncbi:Gfo/Idh/MocA family protein [Rhizorhabdus argentea]|uniref:Gfo/Idh/MocA family protein n=1 Tax=Rhizorhabdus argentea TaxID=1387174 RepID=UPI0030ED8718
MLPLRFAVQGSGQMAATMRGLIGDAGEGAAEAVYIAGRNRDHAARSIAALEAGKAVLCEKPFAMTAGEAEEIVALSRQKRLLYMEAVPTPFLPAVAAALEAARAGRLGTLRKLEASFGYPISRRSRPRLFEADGGVLADRAVYPLMLALIALGPVERSEAAVERDGQGVDVAARFVLRHAGGAHSDLAISFGTLLDNSLWIEGDAGAVEVPPPLLSAQRLSVLPPRRSAPSRSWRRLRQNPVVRRLCDIASRTSGAHLPHAGAIHAHVVEHFSALFRAGALESPVVSHERMLAVARLIEGARRG